MQYPRLGLEGPHDLTLTTMTLSSHSSSELCSCQSGFFHHPPNMPGLFLPLHLCSGFPHSRTSFFVLVAKLHPQDLASGVPPSQRRPCLPHPPGDQAAPLNSCSIITRDGGREGLVGWMVNSHTSLEVAWVCGWRDLFYIVSIRTYKCNFLTRDCESPKSRGTVWACREGLMVLCTELTDASGCSGEKLPCGENTTTSPDGGPNISSCVKVIVTF